MTDIVSLEPYINMLPYALLAFLAAVILTPIIGVIAEKFDFVDLPATMRKRTDKTISQRLHDNVKPRLGALAVIIPFMIIAVGTVHMSTQMSGMFVGLAILTIVGILDDKYELSGKVQLLFQLIAAVIVVITGSTITGISVAGLDLDFVASSTAINFGSFVYYMNLPADIITVIWILLIVNALNWVCGIDALGEGMAIIAALVMSILSVRFGALDLAFIPFVLAFGILGFILYNYPPSKIIGGTVGHGYGFIIAVLSIMISSVATAGNGPKLTTSIIILSIPILDMIWVLINRMKENKTINIFKLLSISGRVHLHHRLMAAGLTTKQTLYVETSAMAIIAVVAFYFGDFNNALTTGLIVIALILILFTFISIRNRAVSRTKIVKKSKEPEDPPAIVDTGPSPEERYAY